MQHPEFPPTLLADLRHVDRAIKACLRTHPAVLAIAGPHLLIPEAQRLHAALTLLTAQLGIYSLDQALHAATAVEIIRAATLTHSHLVNPQEPSYYQNDTAGEWHHGLPLMIGDYLFALAASEMARSPDARIITFFSQAVMTICEGRLLAVSGMFTAETAREHYYTRIGHQTAALFAAACQAGMASGGGSPDQIEQSRLFGYNLGLAYQVIEDIHLFSSDIASDEPVAARNLQHSVITLPFIYAIHTGGGAALAHIAATATPSRIAWTIAEVRRLGLPRAHSDAQMLIARATRQLAELPDCPVRQFLNDFTQSLLPPVEA